MKNEPITSPPPLNTIDDEQPKITDENFTTGQMHFSAFSDQSIEAHPQTDEINPETHQEKTVEQMVQQVVQHVENNCNIATERQDLNDKEPEMEEIPEPAKAPTIMISDSESDSEDEDLVLPSTMIIEPPECETYTGEYQFTDKDHIESPKKKKGCGRCPLGKEQVSNKECG